MTSIREQQGEWHIFYNPAAADFNKKMDPILQGDINGETIIVHNLVYGQWKELRTKVIKDRASYEQRNKKRKMNPEKAFYSKLSKVIKQLGSDQCGEVLNEDFFDHRKIFASINIVIVRINEENKIDTVCTIRALNEYNKMDIFWTSRVNKEDGDYIAWKSEMEKLDSDKKKHLYIDGICSSSGKAKPLLKFLEGKLPEIKEKSAYNAFSLSAINYVTLYYYKLGYRSGSDELDKLMKKMVCNKNFMSAEDEKLFVNEQWTNLIVGWTKKKLVGDGKSKLEKAIDRAERVKFSENYKKRMTELFETHKGSLGGSNPLENGWYMYNDGSYKIQVEEKGGQDNWCSIQGGRKNSKKRTKKRARRRSKRRFLRGGRCTRGTSKCCDPVRDIRRANCHFQERMFPKENNNDIWNAMRAEHQQYHNLERENGFNTARYNLDDNAPKEKRDALENILDLRSAWLSKYYKSAHCKRCDSGEKNHKARIDFGRTLINQWDAAEKNREEEKRREEARLKTLEEKKRHAKTVRTTSNRLSIPKGFKVMTKKNTAKRRRRKKKTKKRSLLKRLTKKIVRLKGFKRKSKKKIKVKKKGTKKKRKR